MTPERIAEILIPEGIDRKGRPSRIPTAYGSKTREGVADLIREVGIVWCYNFWRDAPIGNSLFLCRRGDEYTIEDVTVVLSKGRLSAYTWPTNRFSTEEFREPDAWVILATQT